MDTLIYYLFALNTLGFILMYVDKNRARKRQYRISEKTLWVTAFLGGAIGEMLGMYVFRHKTKHRAFKWGLPLLSILYLALIFSFLS